MKKVLGLLALLALFPTLLLAQDAYLKAQVTEITSTSYPLVQGREIEFQTLQAELEDGTIVGPIFNDYTPVSIGKTIYISQGYNPDTETEGYYVQEIDRVVPILILFGVFALLYVLIAGARGARSLIALVVALLSIWFVLLPAFIAGYSPVLVGVGISIIVLGVAIFITHGFSIVSVASYVGSLIAIVFTIFFAYGAIALASISGLVGDSAGTIASLYGDTINLQGLLLASMLIGVLGVLDDVAVMQAAVVRELFAEKLYTKTQILKRAMVVGQEHAAALVNTLVLAYTAVSLPLFLIILSPEMAGMGEFAIPFSMQISNELFAVEFIRSIVGSFGLVITVPIVTVLATFMYAKYPPKESAKDHMGHKH